MLTPKTKRALGALLLGFVLLLVGAWSLGWIPTYAKYCEYHAQTDHEKCTTYQVTIVAIRYIGWFLDASAPAITAIATAVIGYFTYTLYTTCTEQARLTRAAIKLARQEFIATHRPRIVVRFIQGPFATDDGYQFVWLTLVNIGETPAKIESIGSDLARRVGRGGWLPPGIGADLKPVVTTLETGDRLVMEVKAHAPLNDAMRFENSFNNVELCAVGRIQYRDENGRLLETGFLRVESDGGFIPSKNTEDEYQD
jgi:hypothetical protein